jgi:peroxiredoxin Q/BCP
MASSVRAGDLAPDFERISGGGQTVRLSDYRGRSEVVLFFYPKDDTPACTAEACSFRDHYEDFLGAGAEVIGVSGDPPGEHRAFAGKYRLPFPLLTDADGSLRASFGVTRTLGLVPGRVTFLIDRAGVVRHVYASQLRPASHVREALRALKEMRGREAVSSG